MDDFVVARNPDDASTLPYLVRLPLGEHGVVLKVRDTWPRTAKVYCHPSTDWPADPDVVERVPVRSCVRRGAAIDLVLDRGRENRSQFVFAKARGREMIFWQSARTARQARPNVDLPTQRASGQVLEIVVDSHERYPWKFTGQQATTVRRALPAGDYAVEARRPGRRRRRAQEPARPRHHPDHRQAPLPARRPRRGAPRRPGGGGPLVGGVQAQPGQARHGRRGAGRGPGALPERAHRLLRDAAPRPGVDLPVPRRRPRPPPPGDRRRTGHCSPAHRRSRCARLRRRPPRSGAWALANGHEVSDRGRIPAALRAAYDAAHPRPEIGRRAPTNLGRPISPSIHSIHIAVDTL